MYAFNPLFTAFAVFGKYADKCMHLWLKAGINVCIYVARCIFWGRLLITFKVGFIGYKVRYTLLLVLTKG